MTTPKTSRTWRVPKQRGRLGLNGLVVHSKPNTYGPWSSISLCLDGGYAQIPMSIAQAERLLVILPDAIAFAKKGQKP